MFVTMSEMVGGVAVSESGPESHQEGVVSKPESNEVMDLDSLASSPASPAGSVSNQNEVVPHHTATPMPLLPHLLFQASGQGLPVRSREEQAQAMAHSLKLLSSNTPQPPPGYRTDPGAPPGCFEHSLNILGGRYLLLDQLEGSHLQRCIDVNTKQEFVCKVSKTFLSL